jgi:hypothetical protein
MIVQSTEFLQNGTIYTSDMTAGYSIPQLTVQGGYNPASLPNQIEQGQQHTSDNAPQPTPIISVLIGGLLRLLELFVLVIIALVIIFPIRNGFAKLSKLLLNGC